MASKLLPAGQAYACPHCKGVMQPHKGPWDVLHCVPCQRSVDLWYDPAPEIISVSDEVRGYRPSYVVLTVQACNPTFPCFCEQYTSSGCPQHDPYGDSARERARSHVREARIKADKCPECGISHAK